MSNLKRDLEEKLVPIVQIISNLQATYRIYDYLSSKQEDEMENRVVHLHHIFFKKVLHDAFDNIVLNLFHLYVESETHFISKFINQLCKKGKYEELAFPGSIVRQWKTRIKQQKGAIEEIDKLRDKVVAHKDPTPIYWSSVTKEQVSELIDIVLTIVKDIYAEVYGHTFLIEHPINDPLKNLKEIVAILAERKKQELAPLLEIGRKYGVPE